MKTLNAQVRKKATQSKVLSPDPAIIGRRNKSNPANVKSLNFVLPKSPDQKPSLKASLP